jgi:hypothetical protein
VAIRVLGCGVILRLATNDETAAVEQARHGRELHLEPSRSYRYSEPDRPLADGEVYVVSQAVVDFADGDGEQRWVSYEHHGERFSTTDDATTGLLRLVDDTVVGDFSDLFADMRQGALGVSRWEFMSAPRRVEMVPSLEARLAPLRRTS